MKILLCHNYYQQRGGEDLSFEDERRLLDAHGHDVVCYTRHNDELKTTTRIKAAADTLWSSRSYRQVRALLCKHRPDVAHFTNTFPLISPAVYHAARAEKTPVVQALRNYRLLCPTGNFTRAGRVCEDCLGRFIPWPSVRHGCYRESRAASAVVAGMLTLHRGLRTWERCVDAYYTLTEFAREKFIAGGLPADRIFVKPNFLDPDPGVGDGDGGYAVFVGRLSAEKGVHALLAAWEKLADPPPLVIVGGGPLAGEVQNVVQRHPRIEWRGELPHEKTLEVVGRAACLVMPSVWYETFGRTTMEAFAKGVPVIASNLGAMAELVDEPANGLLFPPGDAAALAGAVTRFFNNSSMQREMRTAARQTYLDKFGAEANYQKLMSIYGFAMGGAATNPPATTTATC